MYGNKKKKKMDTQNLVMIFGRLEINRKNQKQSKKREVVTTWNKSKKNEKFLLLLNKDKEVRKEVETR